jgi:cyclase
MIAGAGANIAVQAGEDGLLLVDTGSGTLTDEVFEALGRLSDSPIRVILNTHAHMDHVGGNATLATAGRPGAGGRAADSSGPGALVIAHEAVLFTMSDSTGGRTPLPVAAWPTQAYDGDLKEVFANGEAIQLFHQPSAHSAGDSLVFFRRSDVVVTGGILDLTRYPVIDVEAGGTFRGVLAGLNRIIELAVPRDWQEGGTMIVPAYGRVADEADVVEYRDMVAIIHDRIRDLVDRGFTLEQVQAARPTFEYDARYGATTGLWTTAMFVEAAYRDLAGAAAGGELARGRRP